MSNRVVLLNILLLESTNNTQELNSDFFLLIPYLALHELDIIYSGILLKL